MKQLILPLLLLFTILTSCVPTKENCYIIKGTDYATKPPIWTVGCEFDSFDYNVIDSIIGKFGKDYTYNKHDFSETYKWNNILVESISKHKVDVMLFRKINTRKFNDGKKHELEFIDLKIFKKGKDFLKPLKFRTRIKTQRFLINVIQ